jgi:quercetin dioxygenase-like cupin family protein
MQKTEALCSSSVSRNSRLGAMRAACVALGMAALAPAVAQAIGFVPYGEGALPSGDLVQSYQVTLSPGEVFPWHYHPGVVYAVIVSGTLTEDEGCGRQLQYVNAGSAFSETPGRVHQVFNLGSVPVVITVTLVVPPAYSGYNSNIFVGGPRCEGNSGKSHLEPIG